MSDFFDDIERKYGGIPPGDHAIEIEPLSSRLYSTKTEKGETSGVVFTVSVKDGEFDGRQDDLRFVLGGDFSQLIRDSVAVLKQWALAVDADTTRTGGDPNRLVGALRQASAGKRVIGTFTHEKRGDRTFVRLTGVRVDAENKSEGAVDHGPF
jgi:hypothetical protein